MPLPTAESNFLSGIIFLYQLTPHTWGTVSACRTGSHNTFISLVREETAGVACAKLLESPINAQGDRGEETTSGFLSESSAVTHTHMYRSTCYSLRTKGRSVIIHPMSSNDYG